MNNSYKRDTLYWNKYYSKKIEEISKHSLFAEFVRKYLSVGNELLEIGCGNGRDSKWFADEGVFVYCIDASNVAIQGINESNSKIKQAICGNFVNDGIYDKKNFDAVYSRFSVHAIDEDQENELFCNVYKCLKEDGIFAIEVRSVNDELYKKGECVGRNAYVYENHYRRFIVLNELTQKLREKGFVIQYAKEERGFAPFDNSNPPIIRVVAKKESTYAYLEKLIDLYEKIIVIDDSCVSYTEKIIEKINNEQKENCFVIGKKQISSKYYDIIDDKKMSDIKDLICTYDFSDKIIYLKKSNTYGSILNYEKEGILSDEELIEALLK